MKITNSIKTFKNRDPHNFVCFRKGRMYIRNKKVAKFKVRQG